jgi:hypothetical protein
MKYNSQSEKGKRTGFRYPEGCDFIILALITNPFLNERYNDLSPEVRLIDNE